MAEKIQADYEVLGDISSMFQACAESTEDAMTAIIRAKDTMMAESAGDWAKKFEDEMSSTVLPKVRRLHEALMQAGKTVADITRDVQEAEDRASNVFNSSH